GRRWLSHKVSRAVIALRLRVVLQQRRPMAASSGRTPIDKPARFGDRCSGTGTIVGEWRRGLRYRTDIGNSPRARRAMIPPNETDRVQAIYDRMAAGYDRMIATWERLLFKDGRQWVCSQARGDVLEVGVGTGRNLESYPADVRLVGIDLSPAMVSVARRTAQQSGREVDLLVGDTHAVSFAGGPLGTVVARLSLAAA